MEHICLFFILCIKNHEKCSVWPILILFTGQELLITNLLFYYFFKVIEVNVEYGTTNFALVSCDFATIILGTVP